MSKIVVRTEKLGKKYNITSRQLNDYPTLRAQIVNGVVSSGRRLAHVFSRNRSKKLVKEDFWALKDLSFDVERGEKVAIIGKNGAGKSTLLKLLSRITEPTTGRITIQGRVSSLLEVGTGFHPELTGRENIFLNGSVLGMSRAEITRKFDEIVDFAEIDQFLDTPVKRYSSGMYVRLAFSVAAHLEPEIFLVDEVLSVGDASFQKKCLGKMNNVAAQGRTVIFVSHNMVAARSLCDRAILLDQGRIIADGDISQVITKYLESGNSGSTTQLWKNLADAPGNETIRLHRVSVTPIDSDSGKLIYMHTPFRVDIEFWNLVADAPLSLNMHIITEDQIVAFGTSSERSAHWGNQPHPRGLYRCTCFVPGNLLNSGVHKITLKVVWDSSRVIHVFHDLMTFEVEDVAAREFGYFYGGRGVVAPLLDWTTTLIDSNRISAESMLETRVYYDV